MCDVSARLVAASQKVQPTWRPPSHCQWPAKPSRFRSRSSARSARNGADSRPEKTPKYHRLTQEVRFSSGLDRAAIRETCRLRHSLKALEIWSVKGFSK